MNSNKNDDKHERSRRMKEQVRRNDEAQKEGHGRRPSPGWVTRGLPKIKKDK